MYPITALSTMKERYVLMYGCEDSEGVLCTQVRQ